MKTIQQSLWFAVREQAALWSTTPAVAAMAASLPQNAPARERQQGAATVAAFLQAFGASYGVLASHPLLYSSGVTWVRQAGTPLVGVEDVPEEALWSWLEAARAVETAHRMTLAWYRSRLPGYPMRRVPQLGRETHLTTQFWTSAMAWPSEDRHAGLQLQPSVPNVDRILGVPHKTQLDDTANNVLAALTATREWQGFGERRSALSEGDKFALRESRKPLADRLAKVDDEAERSIFGADKFRRLACAAVIASLPAGARAYAEAFDTVNCLIDLATSEVFGQLIFYGLPALVPSSSVDILSTDKVEFVTNDAGALLRHPVGSLITVQDPLITDVLRIESMTVNLAAPNDEPSVTVTASFLDESDVLAPPIEGDL